MLKPGHRIGQYRIQSVLGDGGMAIVYRATHVGMGTEHAVKVLLSNLALNPKTVERFRQEARAQFRLRHPNIVQVTDYVETDDAIALVMDLVHGMTLRAAMEQRPGPWPVADVVMVMRPVLDAVAFARREGLDGAVVVHRDLKPENLLLDLGQGRAWPGIPKVADFGIAKVMGTANAGATRTNARLGTVPFMAPEQRRSAKDADPRADVWALGMMLWEMLAGRLPLDPDDDTALLQMYLGVTPIPPLESVVAGVPEALSGVVAQALSVDVAGRFADAGPLLRAVEGAAGGGVRRTPFEVEPQPVTTENPESIAAPRTEYFVAATPVAPSSRGWSSKIVLVPWLVLAAVLVGAYQLLVQANGAAPTQEAGFAVVPVPVEKAQQEPSVPVPASVVDKAPASAEAVPSMPPVQPPAATMTSQYRIDAGADTVLDSRTQLTWQRIRGVNYNS